MNEVDYVEVSRVAHQLVADHGSNAYLFAAKLATEAESSGRADEAAFWGAVSAAVTPR